MCTKDKPAIAVLRWESGKVPKGLMQLESLPGNSTNVDTYPFPVKFVEVPGACVETIITNPSEIVLNRMIEICKTLEKEGIRAVATSCGFNAIFQQKVAEAINIPFFSSSLLLVPMMHSAIGKKGSIAVITANKGSLTEKHMRECGIRNDMKVRVFGLEEANEWRKIFDDPDKDFDMQSVENEIVETAVEAVRLNNDVKAIVLECTDLPPFAKKISERTGLMVVDFTTMMCFVADALGVRTMY